MEIYLDFQDNSENLSDTQQPPETPDSQESELFEEFICIDLKKAYRCLYPNCGKFFNYKSETIRHVLIHQQGRPHTCTYKDCGKTFKRADALRNHLQLHEKVLPYLCDVPDCGKRFATKAAIRYHQIKHENQRTFICGFPDCNKSFLTISQLKQHQLALKAHSKKLALKKRRKNANVDQIESKEEKEKKEENGDLPKAPKRIEYVKSETKTQNEESILYTNTSNFGNIMCISFKGESCSERNIA